MPWLVKVAAALIWMFAVTLSYRVAADTLKGQSQSNFHQLQKASAAIGTCQRIARDMELPLAGSAAFILECTRRSGVALGGVHIEGDTLDADVNNLTGAPRLVAADHTLWPSIIRAENITNLAIRLGETDALLEEFRSATRAALNKCLDAQCIRDAYEQRYREQSDFLKAHAGAFPPTLAINSMMPCLRPSMNRRVVISFVRTDAAIGGTVSGIECSMIERLTIKGDIVQNVATISYTNSANATRIAVVVVFGDNLYWQELDTTSGLQEGFTDGFIIQLPQHVDLNATYDGPRCTEGPSQPAAFATLRPNRTVECPYGFDEIVGRITRLSINTSLLDSVETVERAFGLPEMTTSADDPRIASYMMVLSGKGEWRLLVWVRESFYPLDKGPPGFVPGLRPKRLHNVEDADLRVDMDFLESSPGSGNRKCMPVSPFLDAILAAGWKDIESQYGPPTDGAPSTPIFGDGSKRVSILGNRGDCAQNITLMQGPAR